MSDPTPPDGRPGSRVLTRRRLLATAGGGLAASLAGCVGGSGGSSDDGNGDGDDGSGDEPYGGYLSDAAGFDGSVADRTGEAEVTVAVGVGDSGYGFGPAAVRVSPDTTVVWEWTGAGSRHNVVDEDGGFESEYYASEGATFSRDLSEPGVTRYYCTPHRNLGMKGVIEVVEG